MSNLQAFVALGGFHRADGGSVVLGWRALRPPRVVFVIAVASLINLSLQAKQCREVARAVCVVLLLTILGFDGRGSIWGDKT